MGDVLDHEAALEAAGLTGKTVLKVPLLVAETIDFLHNLLGLVDVSLFTLLLRGRDVEVDLLLELIDALVKLLSLQLAHLVRRLARLAQEPLRVFKQLLLQHLRLLDLLPLQPVVALHRVLSSGKRLLDLAVNGRNQFGEDVGEVSLILAGVRFPLRIKIVHLLEVDVMPALAGSQIMLCVWEQIVRAEVNKIELANHFVVKVISDLQPHM